PRSAGRRPRARDRSSDRRRVWRRPVGQERTRAMDAPDFTPPRRARARLAFPQPLALPSPDGRAQRMARGWQQLIPSRDAVRGEGKSPIEAYSEFMPPPRIGWKAYGDQHPDPELFVADDPFGWHVDEFHEAREIQPGLVQIARQVLHKVACLI